LARRAAEGRVQAQIFRAYLASDGSDAANYNTGSVNVTKSVSILAVPGAVGSVVSTGVEALRIVTAGLVVSLRNLVIVPLLRAGGEADCKLSTAHPAAHPTAASGCAATGHRR